MPNLAVIVSCEWPRVAKVMFARNKSRRRDISSFARFNVNLILGTSFTNFKEILVHICKVSYFRT